MKKQIQTKILKKLNISQSLMTAIKEQNHRFSERDLLVMIAQYSKTYDDKLQLLEFLKSEAEEKSIKIWAEKYVTYQKRILEKMKAVQPNTFFTVKMSSRDEYYTPTLEDALNAIKLSHKHHKKYEGYWQREFPAQINKSKLITPAKSSDMDSDKTYEPGFCRVNKYGKIIYADYNGIDNEWKNNCKGECESCKKPCLSHSHVYFPPFLKQGDLVSYKIENADCIDMDLDYEEEQRLDKNKGKVYAIMAFDMLKEPKSGDEVSCIDLLETYYVKERKATETETYESGDDKYYPCLLDHEHIEYPYLEKEDPAQVPEDIRADYEYYLEFLKENVFNKDKN